MKRALVIGAGGLGSAVLPLLARSGAAITLLDDDLVSTSNLQRQLLFRTEDVDRPKVEVAASRLRELGAAVEARCERLTAENALALVTAVDVVVDGSDNFATRFLANDACVLAGTPLVHGGILRFQGQALRVLPGFSGCYRCLFEEVPPPGSVPSCAEAGVLGALCGIVGARMAFLTNEILNGRQGPDGILIHDALAGTFRTVGLPRDPGCAVCGDAPTIRAIDPARYVEGGCAV